MIIKGTHKREQEYRAAPALNQSALKLLTSTKFYKEDKASLLFYEEKDYFTEGSMADAILLMKEGASASFHTEILEVNPSTTVKSIAHVFMDLCKQLGKVPEPISNINIVEQAMNREDYYTSRVLSSRIRSLNNTHTSVPKHPDDEAYKYFNESSNFVKYIQFKVRAGDKTVVSQAIADKAERIAHSFRTHKNTKHLFNDSIDKIVFTQLPLYADNLFTFNEKCKGLLDMLYVDLTNKTIELIDVKTMGKQVEEFMRSYYDYGYNLQAIWYYELVKTNLQKIVNYINSLLDTSFIPNNFTLTGMSFVVESTNYIGNPMIYKFSPDSLRKSIKLPTNLDRYVNAISSSSLESLAANYNRGFVFVENREVVINDYGDLV